MRVLDADAGRADEVEVGSTGVSVADYDGNEAVDDAERVVTCVFESFLDSHVPEWSITPADELPEFLDAYSNEWGVGIQTYDYPASRLTAAVSDAGDETGEDTQDETDADTGGVVRHMDDLRGDHDVPAPDLPTEAEQDADDEDDETDETRADGGLACRGSFDPRPSVDGITRHVAEFPAFSMAYEADLAVYELIGEQVERIVDAETARLAGGRL